MRLPDPERPFILETDGSRVAVKAVLKQRFDDTGLEHRVGFFSRALTGSERNYAAYEVELYAVVHAVEHFRMFLLDREFLMRTDHSTLCNLLRRDLPPTTRVERWILRLSEYNFKIEYQRGQDNVIADVLSRLPFAGAQNVEMFSTLDQVPREVNSPESEAPRPKFLEDSSSALLISDATSECDDSEESLSDSDDSSFDSDFDQLECEIDSNSNDLDELPEGFLPRSFNHLDVAAPIIDLPISGAGIQVNEFQIPTSEEFATAQSADPELKQLRKWINERRTPSADEVAPSSGHLKCFAQLLSVASLHDAVIVLRSADDPERELILFPSALVERVIRVFHEGPGGAHQVAKATSAKIIQRFFWPGLKRDFRLYVACCPTCERFLRLGCNPRAGLHSMAVGGRKDCVSMDIVGGKGSLPENHQGNNYIRTIIDCFTRYAIAVPLPDQSSCVVISAIICNLITVYGTPRSILTDKGRNFESSEFLEFCHLFRIHKLRTTSYHPQSNGICEKFNQTLKSSLRKTLGEHQISSWD